MDPFSEHLQQSLQQIQTQGTRFAIVLALAYDGMLPRLTEAVNGKNKWDLFWDGILLYKNRMNNTNRTRGEHTPFHPKFNAVEFTNPSHLFFPFHPSAKPHAYRPSIELGVRGLRRHWEYRSRACSFH